MALRAGLVSTLLPALLIGLAAGCGSGGEAEDMGSCPPRARCAPDGSVRDARSGRDAVVADRDGEDAPADGRADVLVDADGDLPDERAGDGPADVPSDMTGDAGSDGPGADADAAPDAVTAKGCDPGDATLVACYAFEDPGPAQILDASGRDHHAAAQSVGRTDGFAGQAGLFGASSYAETAPSADFDLVQLTLEAAVLPTALPAGTGRAVIVEKTGQYSLYIDSAGAIHCEIRRPGSGRADTFSSVIPAGVFTHVACTSDGSMLRVFVDGRYDAGVGAAGGVQTAQAGGLKLGASAPGSEAFVGRIDSVRVFNGARTDAQICADAAPRCP